MSRVVTGLFFDPVDQYNISKQANLRKFAFILIRTFFFTVGVYEEGSCVSMKK
jgi:hypothetical protein